MAYAQTSTVTRRRFGQRDAVIVTITETGVTGSTDDWSVNNLPAIGVLVKVSCNLTAGTGSATTVDPQVGDGNALNNIYENTTAAAFTKEYTGVTAGIFGLVDGTLYGRSKANGTVSGVGTIVTTLWILEGSR
jgi:hypothetical protein